MPEDRTGDINSTVALILEVKYPHKNIPSCTTLETYNKTPIFIPVNITEDAVESVAQKKLGASGPGGTESEALHGWLLKFREYRKRLRTIMETSFDWISNGSPPWAAYFSFMYGHLILLDKQPGVRPVGVGETWRRFFANNLINVTGPEATMVFQDEQIYVRLKMVINGVVNRV